MSKQKIFNLTILNNKKIRSKSHANTTVWLSVSPIFKIYLSTMRKKNENIVVFVSSLPQIGPEDSRIWFLHTALSSKGCQYWTTLHASGTTIAVWKDMRLMILFKIRKWRLALALELFSGSLSILEISSWTAAFFSSHPIWFHASSAWVVLPLDRLSLGRLRAFLPANPANEPSF